MNFKILLLILSITSTLAADQRRFTMGASASACITTQRMHVGQVAIASNTGSMEPMIHAGDAFLVAAGDFDCLPVGAVVSVWWPDRGLNVGHQILARRVAGNGQVYYITKGCNNDRRDPHVLVRDNFNGVMVKLAFR